MAEYDFVERLSVGGARAVLGKLSMRLLLYVLAGGGALLYGLLFCTSRRFTMTTDPSPQRNTLFHRFPSDYVVLRNRWTGHRRVIQISPEPPEKRRPDGTLPYRDRVIYVNRLKDELLAYQQPTRATVIVDTAPALTADRFVKGKDPRNSGGAAAQRVEELLSKQERRSLPTNTTASLRPGEAADTEKPHLRLLVEAEVRMRDTKNGDAQGNLLAFRETIAHVVLDMLAARSYDALLQRTMANGMRRLYAEEMIKNGSVKAGETTLQQLVPDMKAFETEVFAEVSKRMGDDVLLYTHTMSLL